MPSGFRWTLAGRSQTLFTALAGGSLDRSEGIALGDFNGGGTFGVYIAEKTPNRISRVRATNPAAFTFAVFSNNNTGGDFFNRPDSIAFDPFSGSLFVSEDRGFVSTTDNARIWRVKSNGDKVLFASSGNNTQGMSFPESGVMLMSEQDQIVGGAAVSELTVIDGWRNKFNRGDANGDGVLNQADGVFIQNWLFNGGPAAGCWDAADSNDDSAVNISDAIYIYNWLFQGGPQPPLPFFGNSPPAGSCGRDPTIDLLGCSQYTAPCQITF